MPRIVRLLFGLDEPVSRRPYAFAGFSLMAMKYAIDATLFHFFLGRTFMPWDYLNPLVSSRWQAAEGLESVFWWMVVVALPFLWIGVSMSVRRARDAGLSPLVGLMFFLPLINYLVMVLLCLLPSRPRQLSPPSPMPAPVASAPSPEFLPSSLRSALLAAAAGAGFAVVMVLFSVYVIGEYGRPLFVGSPFVVGTVAAWLANRPRPVRLATSQGVAQLAVVVAGGMILLFAIEGLLCLLMAWPIAAAMAALGALLGHSLASHRTVGPVPLSPLWVLALAWPLLGLAEPPTAETPLRAVVTRQQIAAPPAVVWQNVIGFSELPPPTEWIFRAGVAFPQRARIEGEGIGAVRYCEFSTGPFVEPITVWEPPTRLAFDVAAQPHAMRELSPYRISAPHLDGFLQSRRGEFRLVETPTGGTELIGTTWYQVHIGPPGYWQLFADQFIHQIHRRVLAHIQDLSENDKITAGGSPDEIRRF